jgi:hypothetical protein
MNDNRMQLNHSRSKIVTKSQQKRASETRTKIAYGGLVHKSNLPSYLGLELGDEVHIEEHFEKEAIILGILIDGYENMESDPHGGKRDHYRFLGGGALKYGKGPSPSP